MKEEQAAAPADECLLKPVDSETSEPQEAPRHFSRRQIRKRYKRLRSANRDKPYAQPTTFELTPAVPAESEFCSRSEAICAELLRRFVPNFELKSGLTFQVAIGSDGRGNTYSVDFLVDGVLFEYHPVRFYKNKKGFGDFKDREEYRNYTRTIHNLKGEAKRFFHEAMQTRLKGNYFRKRRALLDQHPLFRRMELVVATNPEELYSLIIKRFGKNYPATTESFVKLFDELNRALPS